MNDLKFACRQLLKSPLFALVAITALGLGIGAATTVFSAYNAILLKPLPFVPEQHRLVAVQRFLRHDPSSVLGLSVPDTFDLNDQSKTLQGVAIVRPKTFILTDSEQPERLLGCELSARMFSLLGVRPHLGRNFLPSEEGPGRPPVVILGYDLWQRRYQGETNIVGRTISISDQPALVVGVMPPRWSFPESSDLWSPITFARGKGLEGRSDFFLDAIARLSPGASLADANAELESIAKSQGADYPPTNAGVSLRVRPHREAMTHDTRQQMNLLLGAVLFVQLIACANVANLLLARNSVRSREFAIRMAAGASRWQIVRQLLMEGLLLGATGATTGFILALWGRDLCHAGVGRELPFWIDFAFDSRVFGFTVLIALLSVLAFSLVPALQTVRPEVLEELREGSRGSGVSARQVGLRNALVVGEIALALVLLVGAGLMLRSFYKTRTAPTGYDPTRLLTFRVGLPPQYYTNATDYLRFFREVQQRLRSIPGVTAAAAVSHLPTTDHLALLAFQVADTPEPLLGEAPRLDARTVTPGYFETLGIPRLAGRDFSAADTTNAPGVCIVDEELARRHFPESSALGRQIRLLGGKEDDYQQPRTIVGIVRRIRTKFDNRPEQPIVYFPHTQWPEAFLSFAVRVQGEPRSYLPLAQREIFAVNPLIPLYLPRTMREILELSTWDKRFFGGLFAAFATIALFLAGMGIYGVMAYTVGQRTPEIGLRMALGAEGRDVLRLVLRQGCRLALTGMAIGFIAAFLLAHLLERLLFDISPHDPPIFTAVPLLLGLVAVAACLLPAWRASRIPPMAALRYE
jgi:putative ABC transport system permease protein